MTPALRLGCDFLLGYHGLFRCRLHAYLGAGLDEGRFVGLGFLLRWRRRNKHGFSLGKEVQLVLAWDGDVPGKGETKGEAG